MKTNFPINHVEHFQYVPSFKSTFMPPTYWIWKWILFLSLCGFHRSLVEVFNSFQQVLVDLLLSDN